MKRKLSLATVWLLAAALFVSACSVSKSTDPGSQSGQSSQQTQQPEVKKGPNGETYGGTYRVAISGEPPVIDPQVDTTLQVYNLSRNLFNTLVRYKGNTLELEPELLAEMPKVEADNKTYHFKLRQDVTFTDGSKLTAKDVKFTFERMMDPATKAKNTWVLEEIAGAKDRLAGKAQEISGLKVTGEYTFDIVLDRPFGPFLYNLATPPASIFPEAYVKAQGDKFARNPMGSGPFKLAKWEPNQLLVLEKNPNYFEKGYPFLDKIEYRVIKEEATRWLEFTQGTFDESGIPTAEFETATTSGKYDVQSYVALNTYYLALNLNVVKDKRVREAISLAIDRETILKTILHNTGTVAKGFTTPGIVGALTDAPGFKYDPARAKQLIKEAGAEGMTIESWQRGGDKVTDLNLAIQQMLKDVGINYEVKIVDRAAFNAARNKGEIPANQGNWWADYPDPDNYLYTFFHSASSKGYSVNYSNPEVDKILEEARALADQSKRAKMYQDLERKLIYDEYAIIPLYHLKEFYVTQKGIKGLPAHPSGVGGMKTVWKERL